MFYLAAGIIIFGLALNYLIGPALAKYKRLNREITLSRANLIKYSRLLNQKNSIKDKYKELFSGIKISGQKQDAAVEILTQLENLANSANIRIVDVRPQSGHDAAASTGTLIELRTEGNLEGYAKFIYSIENTLSLLSIKTVQLTAKPASQSLDGNFLIYGFSAEN